jgi:hypothetical protein
MPFSHDLISSFRGGDQSIFVTKKIMGYYWWIQRRNGNQKTILHSSFMKQGTFTLIPKATLISARKYEENSWLTVQLANLEVVRMYKNGASQMEMITK